MRDDPRHAIHGLASPGVQLDLYRMLGQLLDNVEELGHFLVGHLGRPFLSACLAQRNLVLDPVVHGFAHDGT